MRSRHPASYQNRRTLSEKPEHGHPVHRAMDYPGVSAARYRGARAPEDQGHAPRRECLRGASPARAQRGESPARVGLAPDWHNGLPMRAICAWCRREGASGLLGEREPLDDPSETHGICDRHRQELLDEFFGRARPGVRLLFIIAPRERKLYEYLRRSFVGLPEVEVIMERRRQERRRETRTPATERRRAERRVRVGEVFALGYTAVRLRDVTPDRP